MVKTGEEIKDDVYQLVRDSALAASLSGVVCKDGQRPPCSTKEDAVVIFTAGLAEQIQKGTITINIYVPDVDRYDNGVFTMDGNRVKELERLAANWVDTLSVGQSFYKFQLLQTINAHKAVDINQHFISVKLHYEYFNE